MAGRRGRKIDPNSVTQRVLAELQDEQWKDTHELARVLGAPARRVGDICSFLIGQGILENATQPPWVGVWHIRDDL